MTGVTHGSIETSSGWRRAGRSAIHHAKVIYHDPEWRAIAKHATVLGGIYGAAHAAPHLQGYAFRKWRARAPRLGGVKWNPTNRWRKVFITQIRNATAGRKVLRTKDIAHPEIWNAASQKRLAMSRGRHFLFADLYIAKAPGRIRRYTEAITSTVKSPRFWRNVGIGAAGLTAFELGRRYLKRRRARSGG